MFYNVENLFDARHDSASDDSEFLPSGPRHWTEVKYRAKINSLARVIIAAGEWDPPVIAGFSEVENRKVLLDLTRETALSAYGYATVTAVTEDPRGIRTALIYRKDRITLLHSESISSGGHGAGHPKTRLILYTSWQLGSDTLHLFLNHWPSRRRGVLAGEETRSELSSVLLHKIDSISERSGFHAKIIVAGDFNCDPDDPQILKLCRTGAAGEKIPQLIDLAAIPAGRGEGSYKYSGKWEMIDQVMVSRSLLDCKTRLSASREKFMVFRREFLLVRDPSFPGEMPYATFRGMKYTGGFSDHLPLLLDLEYRK
jgi:endonuclease/exonuclease/phosphatase family metal-dependent hydrolase